jgi:alanyl-tRNA synthetase
MTPEALRRSFLDFMEARGAKTIPSASLLPENDPTTLFTGSGMQPMVPYLLGEPHPAGREIVNVQKCLRTVDIDAVGDNSHLTFFEMMGRWELGGTPRTYKRIQLEAVWDCQVGVLGLDPKRLYVTVYKGNKAIGIPCDDEVVAIWQNLFRRVGIEAKVEAEGDTYGVSRGGRIFLYSESENWWSRAGAPESMPVGEPGGPDSEMFFDFEPSGDDRDHPATDTPRFLEIGNNVFMAYERTAEGFKPLPKPNIDYGGGFERIAAAVNGDPDLYLTPFFAEPMKKLSAVSGKAYESAKRGFRIVLDHTRAATFLIGDGALPSNVDAGYVTRRLMRRAIREARKLGIETAFMTQLSEVYIDEANAYPRLIRKKQNVLKAIAAEEAQFQKTLLTGEREMQKHLERKGFVSGKDAFFFYESYGFPRELTEEFLRERNATITDPADFDEAAVAHSEKSRTAAAGKFKGGLADHSEKTTALHTATHLLLAGLQEILGPHVHQKGSNITTERARFDFSHDAKMTDEQIKAVEDYVNAAVAAKATMTIEKVPKQQAMNEGVEGSFWEKYPDVVNVYVFEDGKGVVWSRELCGGPHVENTETLATFGRFKIQKEESSSAGVRRIKALLEG